MKINIFWGDSTDISAKKEALFIACTILKTHPNTVVDAVLCDDVQYNRRF